MSNSYLTRVELEEMGFAAIGEEVFISRKASIYGAENISIGNHVRIDDFALISGNISIGNYVHIAAYVSLFAGDAGIVLEDFSGISSHSSVYAQSDNYKGEALTNPTVPNKYRAVYGSTVHVGKHVVVGTGTTILPGVELKEGSSVGAMSLVNKNTEEWSVYVGIPAKKVAERSKKLLEYEEELLGTQHR